MKQYMSGAKTTAWVEHITLSLSPQVKRAKELKDFIERFRLLFSAGEPLDIAARRRMEAFFGYNLDKVQVHRSYQAEEASRRLGARALTFSGHIFGARQNLDTSTSEGLGLLAHELTHVIQQTQPSRLPQGQAVNQGDASLPATPAGIRSDVGMVLLASPQSPPLTTNPQQSEAQAQTSEQLVAESLADDEAKSPPQINPAKVAEKVYRLMQYDLVLERERATKVGG